MYKNDENLISHITRHWYTCRNIIKESEDTHMPIPPPPKRQSNSISFMFVLVVVVVSVLLALVNAGLTIVKNINIIQSATPIPQVTPIACAESQGLINVSKTEVDRILCDWSVRLGKDSTAETTIYRYTKDVELIIAFRNNKSIGMYVIDQPGLGYTGISVRRVRELEKLIGAPAESIISDDAGIREFGAGDYMSW